MILWKYAKNDITIHSYNKSMVSNSFDCQQKKNMANKKQKKKRENTILKKICIEKLLFTEKYLYFHKYKI